MKGYAIMTAHQLRVLQVQEAMAEKAVGAVFLTLSPDLFYLTGHFAFVSERLHSLVIPRDGRPTMVVPDYEKGVVDHLSGWVDVAGWPETEDPIPLVRDLLVSKEHDFPSKIAVGNHTPAMFLLPIQAALPNASFTLASELLAPMRRVKDLEELQILKEAQDAAIEAFNTLLKRPFAGRTEKQIAADLRHLCEAVGSQLEFIQVGSGPNSARFDPSPTDRIIQRGEPVVIDFGTTRNGYFSDCTRTVHVGPPSDEFERIFKIVREANHAALAAVRPGVSCESVDRAARQVIMAAGYNDYFKHRVGHGIGIEIHEEPWILEGNSLPLAQGMAFTDEPGIYLPGCFGCRLEDVVRVTETGGLSLTNCTHDLLIVE
jgi:Xaa-Pro aminopeptidase